MEEIGATYAIWSSPRLGQIGEVMEFALLNAIIQQIYAILVTKNGGNLHGEEIQVALTAKARCGCHERDRDCNN